MTFFSDGNNKRFVKSRENNSIKKIKMNRPIYKVITRISNDRNNSSNFPNNKQGVIKKVRIGCPTNKSKKDDEGIQYAVLIKKLRYWTTDEDLIEAAKNIGIHDCTGVKIFEHKRNSISKGHCLMFFASEESVHNCINLLPLNEINGRKPIVTIANKQIMNIIETPSRVPNNNGTRCLINVCTNTEKKDDSTKYPKCAENDNSAKANAEPKTPVPDFTNVLTPYWVCNKICVAATVKAVTQMSYGDGEGAENTLKRTLTHLRSEHSTHIINQMLIESLDDLLKLIQNKNKNRRRQDEAFMRQERNA